MLDINSTEDILALQESVDIECKLAQGQDGKGVLPREFWPTYSAFANTQGGHVFLGLKEMPDRTFKLAGITHPTKIIEELWTCLNNSQKASVNLLKENHVNILKIDGKQLLHVHIPQASRKQKPVYIKGNPLTGTYKRFSSTDHLLDGESVRRILAEQVADSRDDEILHGYGVDDLNMESFNAYRQLYINQQPDHVWNQINAQEFLHRIGAWRQDRDSGKSGPTQAGLLMFGQQIAIQEAFPNFMLDYQERLGTNTQVRWVDRITLDGSWSGNVFDFYRKVIRRLTVDLKVPFKLKGDQRQDDTLIHQALREALVNALVHADFTGRTSVRIIKQPNMFGFRNPGLMRIPIEQAISGGDSDCRNRSLQRMFRYIGLCEDAGSGLPNIFHGWETQHWRKPILREKQSPSDQTALELHMLSLVPEPILAQLRDDLGKVVFDQLSDHERLILITAHIEKTVDHSRMMSILNIHPRDLTQIFSHLVSKKLILQEGLGRGTVYFLSSARAEDDSAELDLDPETKAKNLHVNSGLLDSSSGLLDSSSGLKDSSSGLKDSSSGLKDSSSGLKDEKNTGIDQIKGLYLPIALKIRAPRNEVESVILKLCEIQPFRLDELAKYLNRKPDRLQRSYLRPLVKAKKLRLQFPTKPNHPQQAYIKEIKDHDK